MPVFKVAFSVYDASIYFFAYTGYSEIMSSIYKGCSSPGAKNRKSLWRICQSKKEGLGTVSSEISWL